jgi:phosphoribosylglycinamide formyltransferase 1
MNYSFYVSGNATRLISFLKESLKKGSASLNGLKCIVYDGGSLEISSKISKLIASLDTELISIDYSASNTKGQQKNSLISKVILDKNKNFEVDYIFCFGNRILKGELLSEYLMRIINFHPSLLPSFPGLNAIDQALASKTSLLGNTAHFIDAQLDSGPIIQQSILPIDRYRDYEDVLSLQIPMLIQIIKWLENGRITLVDGKVQISDAMYVLNSPFIPALEP